MTTTTELPRHTVQRRRSGDGAPSLSLSYRADSPRAALRAHFERYGMTGVADGETYDVLSKYGPQGMTDRLHFSTEDARRVAREARRAAA